MAAEARSHPPENGTVARTLDAPSIVVLSDRGIFRAGVIELLKQHGCPRSVGCASAEDLLRIFREQAVDLTLIDLEHETENAQHLLALVRRDWPEVTVVAVGTPPRLAALARGADGWIEERTKAGPRGLFAVAAAVGRAPSGRVQFPMPADVERQVQIWGSLTPRESQVLGLLACGIDNGEIGAALGISERAVKAHVSRLFEKFNVDRRTKLALIASHAGIGRPSKTIPFLQVV